MITLLIVLGCLILVSLLIAACTVASALLPIILIVCALPALDYVVYRLFKLLKSKMDERKEERQNIVDED